MENRKERVGLARGKTGIGKREKGDTVRKEQKGVWEIYGRIRHDKAVKGM